MEPKRSDFSPVTLAAMDDVARLVHVTDTMWGMSKEMKNLYAEDIEDLKAPGNRVIAACRKAARDLIGAASGRPKEERVLKARNKNLKALRRAVQDSQFLAAKERDATNQVGNVIAVRVQRPLEALLNSWERRQ